MRMNINVPDDVAKQMQLRPNLNNSAIATEAFRRVLAENSAELELIALRGKLNQIIAMIAMVDSLAKDMV